MKKRNNSTGIFKSHYILMQISKHSIFNRMGVIGCLLLIAIFSACSSSDCPLNNTVYVHANFYKSSTREQTSVTDTLSIIASGRKDSTLYNRLQNFNTVKLPMGYSASQDTIKFVFRTSAGSVTDTLFIAHTNQVHFESLDCSTTFFHNITALTITHRVPTANFPTAIDSIVVVKPTVNYDQDENLKIYFSTY